MEKILIKEERERLKKKKAEERKKGGRGKSGKESEGSTALTIPINYRCSEKKEIFSWSKSTRRLVFRVWMVFHADHSLFFSPV